jgi:hypothetical protein
MSTVVGAERHPGVVATAMNARASFQDALERPGAQNLSQSASEAPLSEKP